MPRKKSMTHNEIREALIFQLSARGANIAVFQDLVDKYMLLQQYNKRLIDSGADNPTAMKEIRENTKAMLTILKEMKITTDNVISEDETGEL